MAKKKIPAAPAVTEENYYIEREHLSFHSIKNFLKCEYLYAEDMAGKFKQLPRDYFLFGSAFDSLLTGDFPRFFVVGKDPKKQLEAIKKSKEKATAVREKYSEVIKQKPDDKKANEYIGKAVKMIEELENQENELAGDLDKESVSDTIFNHVTDAKSALERQTLMEHFPLSPETNQPILITEVEGRKVKAKLDYLHLGNKRLVDWKTTATMKNFSPMDYADQLAWYRMLVRIIYGIEVDCYLGVVDKDTHVKHAYFYQFTPETLDAREDALLAAVRKIKDTEEIGLYEPAALTDIKTCFSCDHYAKCPFTVQKEFDLI